MKTASEMMIDLNSEHAKRIELLQDNEVLINALVLRLNTCKINVLRFELDMTEADCLNIGFAGTKREFRLVWATLRGAGFEPAMRPENKLHAEFYTWWHPKGIDSKLKVWFSFSSTECKLTKVRTEMVERDVYEVKCG